MPTYNETGAGGAVCHGCCINSMINYYPVNFKQGDIAFRQDRANKGILEPVAIKQVFITFNGNVEIIKYIDTFNALYTDVDLVDQATAIALATAYQQLQIAKLETYIDSLCP